MMGNLHPVVAGESGTTRTRDPDRHRQATLQVYTGDGKGKTTAALGSAMRAVGHGWNVLFIQFMKGDIAYGELEAANQLPGLDIIQKGRSTFVEKGNSSPEDRRLAEEGLALARRAFQSDAYDMVILDEIIVAVEYGVLEQGQVLALLSMRPPYVEVILTGRYATPQILERADTVTEMREVRHHYRQGMEAREGIEF